jgi:hypothetical protein
MQAYSLKKTLESQNSYEIQTRSGRAGHNKERERDPQNLGRIKRQTWEGNGSKF